ncbi:MAG: 4-hydroxythreonine-4-phosphate dehydrogenase PdxA [Bacteroidota bacterium]
MSHIENEGRIRIGISVGDINGIGIETIMKTFIDHRMTTVCTPIIYCNHKVLSFHRKALNLNDFNYNSIKNVDSLIYKKVNVINTWEEDVAVEFGQSTPLAGKYALMSLEAAAFDLHQGKLDAIVTAPINKNNIQQSGFKFPGHTEYLADKFDSPNYLMMLVAGDLRIGTVTGHIPLSNVSKELSIKKIVAKIKAMNSSLKQDFGIDKPKIAVLGLNPHSSDNGLLGSEEKDIIIPAIKQAFDEKLVVLGPYPADGFFGSSAYHQFDGILAMYHDQGLIPFKTISFDTGVNFTAGLSKVRTSPDHGTGYDIAGKCIASESSFREAIYLACDIINKREEYSEISKSPLKFSKMVRDR